MEDISAAGRVRKWRSGGVGNLSSVRVPESIIWRPADNGDDCDVSETSPVLLFTDEGDRSLRHCDLSLVDLNLLIERWSHSTDRPCPIAVFSERNLVKQQHHSFPKELLTVQTQHSRHDLVWDAAELRHLLCRFYDGPQTRILQRFVPCPNDKASMWRCQYTLRPEKEAFVQVTALSSRTSNGRSALTNQTKAELAERFLVGSSKANADVIRAAQASEPLVRMCKTLVRAIEERIGIRVQSLQASFVRGLLVGVRQLSFFDRPRPYAKLTAGAVRQTRGHDHELACNACRSLLPPDDVDHHVTLLMLMQLHRHLLMHGLELKSSGRKTLSLSALNLQALIARRRQRGDWFATVRVCTLCYSLHQACTKLEDFGERLTSSLGIRQQQQYRHRPIPLRSAAVIEQLGVEPVPDTLMLCRALVYLDHLQLDDASRPITHISVALSRNATRKLLVHARPTPTPGGKGRRRRQQIQQARLFYFFTSRRRYHEFVRNATVQLELLGRRDELLPPLGRASVRLAQFSSPLNAVQNMLVGFGGNSGAATSLRMCVGVVLERPVPSLVLDVHELCTGVYVPNETGFFTCDALPSEWLQVLPDHLDAGERVTINNVSI